MISCTVLAVVFVRQISRAISFHPEFHFSAAARRSLSLLHEAAEGGTGYVCTILYGTVLYDTYEEFSYLLRSTVFKHLFLPPASKSVALDNRKGVKKKKKKKKKNKKKKVSSRAEALVVFQVARKIQVKSNHPLPMKKHPGCFEIGNE